MKGVVFNVLEEFIIAHSDERTYEEIFALCPLKSHQGYVGPGTYPDTDLNSIIDTTCRRLGLEPDHAVELFGEFLFSRLVNKYPQFISEHHDPLTFLKTVDEVIHVEVRKLMRDTNLPSIKCTDGAASGVLIVDYQSNRSLCRLMRGLLIGVGVYFNVPLSISETQCVRDGADSCRFDVMNPALSLEAI
ncbi:MAG: heme NO-binding domain-containing protein [Burkholderiaceae bacterium]